MYKIRYRWDILLFMLAMLGFYLVYAILYKLDLANLMDFNSIDLLLSSCMFAFVMTFTRWIMVKNKKLMLKRYSNIFDIYEEIIDSLTFASFVGSLTAISSIVCIFVWEELTLALLFSTLVHLLRVTTKMNKIVDSFYGQS